MEHGHHNVCTFVHQACVVLITLEVASCGVSSLQIEPPTSVGGHPSLATSVKKDRTGR